MIVSRLGCEWVRPLGSEYALVRCENPASMTESDAWKYVGWNLPMDHMWPCNPGKMEGFVEKAAQAVVKGFGDLAPQGIFIGPLDAAGGYYKQLASNLRGRALQLFAARDGEFQDVEAQDPRRASLFCLVGKEGLFCGLQSPLACNGFYPGGTKFIPTSDAISRAGAKVAGALHFLGLHHVSLAENSRWLELGACPGGMTAELLRRDFRVTAIDRAPLDRRLDANLGLRFILADVAEYRPAAGERFDAILCDMNGDALASLAEVTRLSSHLKPEGLVIFTLKTPGAPTLDEMDALYREVLAFAASRGLRFLAGTHLPYNRQEFTLFFTLE